MERSLLQGAGTVFSGWMFGFQKTLDFPIEVRGDALVFVESLILCFGLGNGSLSGNTAFPGEDLVLPEGEEFIDALGKLLHGESVLPLNQILDVVEVAGDCALQLPDLLFIQIVLSDGNIRFEDAALGLFFRVVRPICSLVWSALEWTISAAVWPVMAKWNLF